MLDVLFATTFCSLVCMAMYLNRVTFSDEY
jgi:hypothetical protein